MQTSDASNLFQAEAELALIDARKEKAEKTKSLGSPIELKTKPLAALVRGGQIWIAESGFTVRTVDLETGKTRGLYRGHSGPVTTLAFLSEALLVTGSWDKTIKLWDTETKTVVSSTPAHDDFVKAVLVIPSLDLLVSSGSDKTARFWDLSEPGSALPSLGFVSSHTRPVECIEADTHSESSATLYTADSMGVINVWDLRREYSTKPRCQGTLLRRLGGHRTGITQMLYGSRQLWTASSDETVLLQQDPPAEKPEKPIPALVHPKAVKAILPLALTELAEPYLLTAAGELIRAYDVSSPDTPELLCEVDVHWHDVTAIQLWMRKFPGDDGRMRIEPWIVSTSLDCTIRKWRLSDLLSPSPAGVVVDRDAMSAVPVSSSASNAFQMTEEEERELAELMDS